MSEILAKRKTKTKIMKEIISIWQFKIYLDEEYQNAKVENKEFDYSYCEAQIEGLYNDGMIDKVNYNHQLELLSKYFSKWYPVKK